MLDATEHNDNDNQDDNDDNSTNNVHHNNNETNDDNDKSRHHNDDHNNSVANTEPADTHFGNTDKHTSNTSNNITFNTDDDECSNATIDNNANEFGYVVVEHSVSDCNRVGNGNDNPFDRDNNRIVTNAD
jgi:hypothetical protein